MKSINKIIFAALLGLSSVPVLADVAVIVHPSNSAAIDNSSVTRIFLGKMKSFPAGGQAVPINQKEHADVTNEFNSKVLNKSASQLKAYWSKLVFTGKGTPPKEVMTDLEVISLVSSNPNLIGYINANAVTADVKVIGQF